MIISWQYVSCRIYNMLIFNYCLQHSCTVILIEWPCLHWQMCLMWVFVNFMWKMIHVKFMLEFSKEFCMKSILCEIHIEIFTWKSCEKRFWISNSLKDLHKFRMKCDSCEIHIRKIHGKEIHIKNFTRKPKFEHRFHVKKVSR